MSYGLKYNITWTDFFNKPCELRISQRDYAGASGYIVCAANPVSFNFDTADDNLHCPVNGSSCTIRVMSQTDFQYLDLFTSDNRKYKVQFYINSTLFWSGFILPDQYQEEYRCAPYVNEFTAADQIGFLRSVNYDLTGVTNIKQSLDYIFNLTGLELNLYEGLNIYEDNMNSTAADSPLDQTYYDNAAFSGMSCYDVLWDHMLRFGAFIRQSRGAWIMHRVKEIANPFTRRLWTWSAGSFSYTSNASFNPIIETTSAVVAKSSLVRVAGGSMWINPAWRRYNIVRDLGLKDNMLKNGDFTAWTGADPDDWYIHANILQMGNKVGILETFGFIASSYISQTITNVKRTLDQKIKINFEYHVNITSGGEGDVYFELTYVNGGYTFYYDFDNNNWTGVGTPRFTRHYTEYKKESVEITTATGPGYGPNPSGTLTLKIYSPSYVPGGSGITLIVDSISLQLVDASDESQYDGIETTTVLLNDLNNFVPEDIAIVLADMPDLIDNATNVYKYSLYREAGLTNLTSLWSSSGDASKSLMDNLIDALSEQYQNPQQILSITLYSSLIAPGDVLKEVNNNNFLFLIKRANYDQKYGRWEVEAHKLGQVSYLLKEDGDFILTETGDKIIL